jgi:hypothetical protein
MKYLIEFDTAVDRYEDVLQQLRTIYGVSAEPEDRALMRKHLTHWLAAIKKPGDQMVVLLSHADQCTMTKDQVMDALGIPPGASHTLSGITNSVGAAAKKHLPRKYWFPFGSMSGYRRHAYTLDEDIAEAVKKLKN